MAGWMDLYPGDRALEFFLVVTTGVMVASTTGWLIARRLVRRGPALRHLVLLSALLFCLGMPAGAWVSQSAGLKVIGVPILGGEQGRTSADPARADNEPASIFPADAGYVLPEDFKRMTGQGGQTTVAPSMNAAESREPGLPAEVQPAMPRASATNAPSKGGLLPMRLTVRGMVAGALLVWAVGAVVMLARLAWNCLRLSRLGRSARLLPDQRKEALFREVATRLGAHRAPLLLISRFAIVPLATGLARPAIIIPERILGAVSDDELRDIFAHEVAHLLRRDQWIVLLEAVAGAVYWPIVMVHGLNRELRRAREELCDNVVLKGRDAVRYAQTLLHVAELLMGAPSMGMAAGMMGARGELEKRIAGLIDPRRNRLTKTSRRKVGMVIALFIAAGLVACGTRLAAPTAPSATGASVKPTPPAPTLTVSADPDDPRFAGHFSGQVTGPDGKPLNGARIYIVRSNQTMKDIGPVRALTGADGHFEFDAPDMTYTQLDGLPSRRGGLLFALADGFAPDWMETWGETGSSTRSHWDPVKGAAVNLQLASNDVPVHGRFLDADGRPLMGARVQLIQLMVPLKRDLDAHLKREQSASLFLSLDYERSLYQPRFLTDITFETKTDADGRFIMAGLGRDRLAMIRVSSPAVADTEIIAMTREAPDVRTRPDFGGQPTGTIYGAGFTLQLKRGLTVTGLVRDKETHAPIPDMWVTWRRNPITDPGAAADAALTDAQGRFTITGLNPDMLKWEKSFRDITAFSQPGGQYAMGRGYFDQSLNVVVECRRGIPFHLKLFDEQGNPVEGSVEYYPVGPNPHTVDYEDAVAGTNWAIMNCAARRSDGTYEGFVVPGPGAVLVKTPGRSYRPAHVDPKAFFAPGRTDWTAQEKISTYGTQDTVSANGWIDQHDYAAIVLVNPAPNSSPLELTATVVNDRPRQVSLVDMAGRPVVGVTTDGLTFFPWDYEPPLRAATISLTKLHPNRVQRITFLQEKRKLIGELMARGDGDSPYVVRMEPWGRITGRLLDENGRPFSADPRISLSVGTFGLETNADAAMGEHAQVHVEESGKFIISQLVPGQHYTGTVYRGIGNLKGNAFERVVLGAGEVRDLGDIRVVK